MAHSEQLPGVRSPGSSQLWLVVSGGYARAVALVGAALLLSLGLQREFANPFWFFFPLAIIASTWFGGKGPGWLAVGLSTIAVLYYFIPPVESFAIKPRDIPFLVAFVLCQVTVNWLITWRKNTEDALRRARDELEIRVAERTAELRDTNQMLVAQMEEQKRTQEALQATRTELARVSRISTIGELTASIAHEVNQPLAAVVANGDACIAWLSHDKPDLGEARAAAERMIQGASRASEVIVRIRSLITKATPGKSQVQINEIVKETLALVGSQTTQNDIGIVTQLSSELPAVLGDSIQLQQVILNLLANGIDAMTSVTDRPRRITVRTESREPGQIRVSVADTGVGVSAEVMARLFEPFFTTRAKGMGMGLAISRSIIEGHGGRLWAEPNHPQGALFQFTLPVEGAGTA